MLLQRDPKFAPSTSSGVPLPSPDAIKTRRECDEKEREREKEKETAEATNSDGHNVQHKRLEGQKSRIHAENNELAHPCTHHARTSSLESYVNIPTSAPCSPYAGVEQTNCLWGAHYMTPPGLFLVWSAPEMPQPQPDPIVVPSLTLSHHEHTSSLGNSTLQSPRLTLHLPSSPHTRREANVVHPLPLPPAVSMPTFPTPKSPVASGHDLSLSGASLPSQSTPVALHQAKTDFSISSQPVSPIGSTGPEFMKIKSQWQKGKLIGRGTFGSVYVASNRETGALCAMKEVEMLPDDSKSAECIRQLEQEIKVLSCLKHANIVQYYGSEIVGDKFYIYLEYVHPGSINKFIHDHCGAITESVVRNFTRHILCGLAYLHSKKTIHRDIKGANLLVDAYGVVKLADFGMAKHLNGQTAYLSLKGSPYWMAPELLQSEMQTDASSDVALAVDTWSLGCTIIEMMDGKPPWSEYEGAAAMFKVLKETPPIPETMSPEGKDFLQCCFRRNPAERPTACMLLDHPFVNYSNMADACSQSNKEIKDSVMFLRERARYKQDQVPPPLEVTHNKEKLSNNLSFEFAV